MEKKLGLIEMQVESGNTLITLILFFWLCVDVGIGGMWVSMPTREVLTVLIFILWRCRQKCSLIPNVVNREIKK